MIKIAGKLLGLALAVSLAFVLIGCGGGGGGGGVGGSGGVAFNDTNFDYSGMFTKAVVTSANAEGIAIDAYQGGNTGSSIGGAASLTPPDDGSVGQSRYTDLSLLLKEALSAQVLSSMDSTGSGAAKSVLSVAVDGDCGGNVSGSLTHDDLSGAFGGTIYFNGYCSANITVNGSVIVTGNDQLPSGHPAMDLHFSSLTVSGSGYTYAARGNISLLDYAPAPTVYVTIAMIMQDSGTGEAVKITGWYNTVNTYSTYVGVDLTQGRIYSTNFGYVDCVTTSTIYTNNGSSLPYSGTMECTGDAGASNGDTRVVLTVDNAGYTVTADTTGDGNLDYDAGFKPWSSL